MNMLDVDEVERRLIDLQSITGVEYRVIADIAMARWMGSIATLLEIMDLMHMEALRGDLSQWQLSSGTAGGDRADGDADDVGPSSGGSDVGG